MKRNALGQCALFSFSITIVLTPVPAHLGVLGVCAFKLFY